MKIETENFKALVSLWLKIQAEWDAFEFNDDDPNHEFADAELRTDLAKFIAEQRNPPRLGDLAGWEHYDLKWEGIEHMIDRDAGREYDSVDGYTEVLFEEGVIEQLLQPENAELDGRGVCYWIDAHVPMPEPEPV